MKASYVLTRVQDILQDTTGVRWPDTELLRYLNDAQHEVVLHKPDASSDNITMSLVPGTRQRIPNNALRLLDIVRNVTSGTPPGPGHAVTLLGRGVLDAQRRGWHAQTPSVTIEHYIYDPRDPKTFYVYPPATAQARLELIVSTAPAVINTINDDIWLDSIYVNVLIDYVLYRAYSKDADFAANLDRAMTHYQAFATALGIKTQGDYGFVPRAAARDSRDGVDAP